MSITTAARQHVRVPSAEASRLYADLLAAPLEARRGFMRGLTPADWVQVLNIAAREGGTPYALWRDDPVGFVTDVLRENLWSKPKQILSALPHHNKVAVPSCFASSKTWSASRSVLWFAFTHAPGTAKVITMAPTWRQVVRLLWSEVRFAHSRANLPGTVDMAQLKIQTASGMDEVVAYGLSAAPWQEASIQGIHAPNLLLIVDEAGGISHVIGRNLRGMTSTEGSRMLAIGNPPTDDEGSWFEGLCSRPDEALVIPISAFDTPGVTGETAPICRTCTGGLSHTVSKHLVEPSWITETIAEHGEESNYVQAKVYARFPKGGPSRVLPSAWIDGAAEAEEPDSEEHVCLTDLGLPEEHEGWMVKKGSWVRLGVDVAADGGDEFVIARCVGDLVTIQHHSSGAANAHGMTVAGVVLKEIRKAEALAGALGSTARIHVKIDCIGVGWNVADVLRAWGSEELHTAKIVPVNVAEKTEREPDGETLRPAKKRDEMWLSMRSLVQPRGNDDAASIRLRVDRQTLAQLRTPMLSYNSQGMAVVESKKSMKDRGLSSPDRGEAVLMAVYEPIISSKRKKARLVV